MLDEELCNLIIHTHNTIDLMLLIYLNGNIIYSSFIHSFHTSLKYKPTKAILLIHCKIHIQNPLKKSLNME